MITTTNIDLSAVPSSRPTIKYRGTLTQGTPGSAAYDLISTLSIMIPPGERRALPTGVTLEMPQDMAALVTPRSGLALKMGVTVLNTPGLIDSDYRGEIGVILFNASPVTFHVQEGDRIAQLLFTQLPQFTLQPAETFSATERGAAGFGSTGV